MVEFLNILALNPYLKVAMLILLYSLFIFG